jgi:hypothetical protein
MSTFGAHGSGGRPAIERPRVLEPARDGEPARSADARARIEALTRER